MEELEQLYDEMRAAALRQPRTSTTSDLNPYRRTLENGIRLVFYLAIGRNQWKLSVYQAVSYPKPGDLKRIRQAFQVPDLAKDSRSVMSPWYIVRYEWPATAQGKLFDIEPAAPAQQYYRS